MSALGCDINRSTQHIEQHVLLVFALLTSFSVVRLVVVQPHLIGSDEHSTSPFLSGSTVAINRWYFRSTPVARDSVDHRSTPLNMEIQTLAVSQKAPEVRAISKLGGIIQTSESGGLS